MRLLVAISLKGVIKPRVNKDEEQSTLCCLSAAELQVLFSATFTLEYLYLFIYLFSLGCLEFGADHISTKGMCLSDFFFPPPSHR